MSDFARHLDSLVTFRATNSALNTQSLPEWTRPSEFNHSDDGLFQVPEDDLPDGTSTVLDVFSGDEESPTIQIIIQTMLSKPDPDHALRTLMELLAGSRTDDEISNEIVELIGFDQIELVVELLGMRHSAAGGLSRYLDSREDHGTSKIGTQSSRLLVSLAPEDARRRIEETLKANAARPLFTGTAQEDPEVLPHIYTSWSNTGGGGVLSQYGSKYMLPIGTTRQDYEDYEEVVVPPAKTVPPRDYERLIPVSELDELARGSFPGYKSLNRVQSIVYPTAYKSNENMLVCAPTGAGKTDVAMLTVLRVLDQHRSMVAPGSPLRVSINRDDFKIIYVAPMKALASEIVHKLGKRLKWLSILVRELTGDMQLTKAEIAETQIIVTTPEKWDVVTRKPTGEGELASKLKLLIIDEVHLLNGERGAVIETIVARTLRQVESSQSVIRVVGLSATLPNYIDVADFLNVSRYTGLFYFDTSFRPVPLEQHFIGIRGKPGSQQSKRNLDRVTFQKVSDLVSQGHQVMVFVHARKETVGAALALKDAATQEGTLDDYSCQDHPQWEFFRRNIGESHNKEMKQLFDDGFGIHHAGMLRSDRNLMERTFQERAIKVLCCTATLAWGVNLPAHAVVIKGTQLYDSGKGSFVDLPILDVLQIFGRAGRPGLESSGEGYICTTQDKLTHFLDAVASQNPIESQFQLGIVDALNAEISLGTVTNVEEGVRWLGYTYLQVRMRRNPTQYGISRETLADDSGLIQRRTELIISSARRLAKLSMIDFDTDSNTLIIKDVGRIAAKYYIRHQSIEVFQTEFKPQMTEADVLNTLSKSTEFNQIQMRESETKELEHLMEYIPCELPEGAKPNPGKSNLREGTDPSQRKITIREGTDPNQGKVNMIREGTEPSQGKVNILLQAFISKLPIQDFALVSDGAYVAQNGGRILRALFEIAISQKWAGATTTLLGMSKAVEKRMWPYEEPLKQFSLKAEIFYGLDESRAEYHPSELVAMTAAELGTLIHLNEHQGRALLTAAKQFPSLELAYSLRPLGPDILKIVVTVTRAFEWNPRVHGTAEPFWLWVEDHDGKSILQLAEIFFRESTNTLDVEFVISIAADRLPPSVTIRVISDRWLGADDELPVPLDGISMPDPCNSHVGRIDVGFLPLSSIRLPRLEGRLSRVREFNAIQTQVFWSLVNTKLNILVAAPAASGKSFLAYIVIWKTLLTSTSPNWVLIVAPDGSAALKTISELRFVSDAMGIGLEHSTGINLFRPPSRRHIKVVTATNFLQTFSANDAITTGNYPEIILYENLEQMDASYELCATLLKHATERFPSRTIGLTRSLIDPTDLASWLGVESMGLHSFLPKDREQPLTCSIQPYTITNSSALYKALAKPVYTAIQSIRTSGCGIVFVPSRKHCGSVGQDLITQCALVSFSERGFLPESVPQGYVEDRLTGIQDPTLIDFVSRGVGLFHRGISKSDRHLVLELFAEGVIKLLIMPYEISWTLPVRAEVVVVMGTQYIAQDDLNKSSRRTKDYTILDVVQMQSCAIQQDKAGHFVLFCPAGAVEMFNRFLNEGGLPLESQLLETEVLKSWYEERRKEGTIRSKQDEVDVLSSTYLARRIKSNPTYYDHRPDAHENEALSRIVDRF